MQVFAAMQCIGDKAGHTSSMNCREKDFELTADHKEIIVNGGRFNVGTHIHSIQAESVGSGIERERVHMTECDIGVQCG